MQASHKEPGIIFSAAVHAGLLAVALVSFSDAPKFKDAQESIPVEMITESEMNQITKGEEKAKPEENKPRVDQKSEQPEPKPDPPVKEAKQDIPTPPPPFKRIPEPAEAETPAPEPPKVAALPPPRPPEPTPEKMEPEPPAPVPPVRPPTPKAEPKPEPPKPLAKEAPEPPPPPKRMKPEPQKQAEATPEPEKPAKPAPLPPRRPPTLRKVEEKPKPDQLAKLVDATKNVKPAPARPRSGDETSDPKRKYDPTAISKLLSREPAQQRGSTGQTPQRTASLGARTASAAKMAPNMWAQLDGYLQGQYKNCWSYIGTARGNGYVPQVRVTFAPTGALIGRPVLNNPPSDPALRSLADSALRAVQRCNPLRIPAQYAPYYEEWRDRILRFDPEEMMG